MCGILFLYSIEKIEKDIVQNSLDSIFHRGPDDYGLEFINNVALGSRRLAIQDLSPKGHMPMSDSTGRYRIVFNGEVYNFKEIKKDLQEFEFQSNSDTEIVLYSYIKWGHECLKKFRGMFAFVIYDQNNNSVFFARDRFGKKPILFFYNKKMLIIASEAKQLLKINPKLAVFDNKTISDLLSFRYIPDNKTGFKNIFSLPQASYVYLRLGEELTIKNYWNFLDIKTSPKTEEETLNLIETELIASVKYRLIADVPVGVFLSGGLDSSLITAIASQQYGKTIRTFSVGYKKHDQQNELDYAKIVSQKYQTKHEEIPIDFDQVDLPKEFDNMIEFLDRPIADPAIFPSFLMSREVSKSLKAVLNGDGGDELFSGYPKVFDLLKINKYFKLPKPVRTFNYILSDLFSKRYGFIFQGLSNSEAEAYLYKIGCFHALISNRYYIDKNSILKSEFYSDSSEYLKELVSNSESIYKRAEAYDVQNYMPFCTLPKIDFATMAYSLEARSPFLDNKLAEIAFSIEPKLKLKNNTTKYLIKKIAEKYLPFEIIYRKKQGFSVPFARWFRENLNEYVHDLLLSKNSFISDYLNMEIVEKLIQDHTQGKDYSNHIWILIVLEKWGEKYIYGNN